MIMVTFTGAPLGGFVGGLAVSWLLHEGFAWPVIFILGGVFPLVLVLVMILWLPESPRFLAARANLTPRHRALLHRLDIAHAGVGHTVDLAAGNPITMLFGEGYALRTILLWIIFFCSLMNLFLFVFWLPEILHLTGMTPAESVFATSLHTLGAIAAVLYLGYLIDRFGPQRALAANFAVGLVFILLLALAALPYLALLAVVFLSGATVIGSQTGANAACGAMYPARMRTSGIGWALGVGRLGGIAAAPLGGFLLGHGLAPRHVFLSAVLFAVIAAVATALLGWGAGRNAPAGLTEAAQ
jgi:MFS transporter, AAHS family, 4-hydroxybenzoate transporter